MTSPGCGFPVKEAVELLDKFLCGNLCLDDFIEDILQDLESPDHPHKKFILDAVSGCVQHKKLLDVVVNCFYGQHGKYLYRRDRSQFVIICYLAMFALDDLGFQPFSSIVKSLDAKMMHAFLSFFFSNLTTCIQNEWNSLYDSVFVEEQWIGPLLRWRPQINVLMDQLAVKQSQGSQRKRAPIKTTEPQEFCLTKPKPRLPPEEHIPQLEKAKPVPNSTYRAPSEIQLIKESKLKNRQKAEELLRSTELDEKVFKWANPKKSARTKKILSQIEEDLNSKLKFDSFHSSGLPSGEKDCPIKLNKAARLRREVLCERWMEEEERAERQKETSDQDLQQMLPESERRRLEVQISHLKGALARQQLTEQNQKTAQLKKEETAQMMQRYAEKRLQEEKAMRDLVQQVADGNKNSREAKEKLQKLKREIVKEVSEQSQELLRHALEEAQAELSRKFQIIQEIHSIESLSRLKIKSFDDTETAGHRLLEEMSLVELRERLVLLKQTRQTEQEEKRREILEERQRQKQVEDELQDFVDLHQRVLARAAATRKEERRARLEVYQGVVAQDEAVVALKEELQQMKQEHQKLKLSQGNKIKNSKQSAGNPGMHKQASDKVKSWAEVEQSLALYIQNSA